jgi:Xaa-Pro dipeptidase
MRTATRRAVAGHIAARERFRCRDAGVSEFELNLTYLAAAEATAAELPYSNIVALNRHAGVLHYQHYDRAAPARLESFLIDAGAQSRGYAADITRTYSAADDLFAELIERLDIEQRSLIDTLAPGIDFVLLHTDMHRRIAKVLREAGIVRCAAEHAFEAGVTEAFFPHGLGHLIGLQTHDVAGQQSDRRGRRCPPPERYPALRLTRVLEAGTVVTIEPGLYFIPQLLRGLRAGPLAGELHWDRIDELSSRGGIRIEDNVLIAAAGNDNFTRTAFAEAERQAGA